MTERATHETLAKDLYTLAGQFSVFESQMEEMRGILTDGFTRLEAKLDSRMEKLEERVRNNETAHAERDGKHSAIGWFADSIKIIVAAIVGALSGHLYK
jgi:hypothetical protein